MFTHKRNLIVWASMAAAVACGAGSAMADEAPAGDVPNNLSMGDSLDSIFDMVSPVVTTATKDARRIEEVPSVITVLTRHDLANWGYRTLAEALQHVVGFYVVDDQVTPNIAVRGISGGFRAESGVVKVLIDGTPVSFRTTEGNWLGASLIPMEAIDHIEIIRGPVSALYGADAFLGVINIITRNDNTSVGSATMGGSWHQSNSSVNPDADVAANYVMGKVKIFAAARANWNDASNYELVTPTVVSNPSLTTANLPDYASTRNKSTTGYQPSWVGMLRVNYDISESTSLSVSGYLSDMERVDEFASLVQLTNGNDPAGRLSQNKTHLTQGLATLKLRQQISDDVELNAMVTYFAGNPVQDNRLEVDSDFYYVRRHFGFSGTEANVEVRGEVLPELTLTGGLNYFYDVENLIGNDAIAKLPVLSVPEGGTIPNFGQGGRSKVFNNFGAYLQAVAALFPRYLTVAAGVRFDYHNVYKSQPSARLGLVSEPLDRTYVKLLYGTAFRAPSPQLLYAASAATGDITGNSSLLAQRIHTIELEISRRFLDIIMVSTGLSYSILLNKAEFTENGTYEIATNSATLNSLAWETRGRILQPENYEGYASFELNSTSLEAPLPGYKGSLLGTRNSIYPTVQLHVGAIKWMPKWYLRGMIEMTYVSDRLGTDSNVLAAGQAYSLPGYFMLDLGLASHDLRLINGKSTTLTVLLRNVTGDSTADPGYLGVDYPRTPRTLFFYVTQEI